MRVCVSRCQRRDHFRSNSPVVFRLRRRRRYNSASHNRTASSPFAHSSPGSAVGDLALINVDYISPSLWLGVVLGVTGMVLYSLKFRDARGTTEGDIVAASLFVMCGGILTLQGWRLDPILMLSEFVLGGVGIFYMVQTVNLRKQLEILEDNEQEDMRARRASWSFPRQRVYERFDDFSQLPAASENSDIFQPRYRAQTSDLRDRRSAVDPSWPRTPGRSPIRQPPSYPPEGTWDSESNADIPYGVETSSPKGRVSRDMWDRKDSG